MNNFADDRLLFAVPKKGRLYERVLKVLAGAGIEYVREPRLDIALCSTMPLALVFLPAHDIAEYVAEGKCDVGITGQDIIAEADVNVKTLLEFGFGKCRLALQGPKGQFKSGKELTGKRVVTSFPGLAKQFFDKIDDPAKPTKIKYVTGSVEVACALGIADGIVDLVETGTTMRAAGLEVVETIMDSQTVLITKQNVREDNRELIVEIRNRINGYLTSTKHVMVAYNIGVANLEQALKVTPGMEGATVVDTANKGWKSVSALIKSKETSVIMEQLVKIGAKSILITCLQNCRFPSLEVQGDSIWN